MANANIFHLYFVVVVVILLSSQQTLIFGFEPYLAAVSRNVFSGVVFTWWKVDFLIRKMRWNVRTVYLGSNNPERQEMTNASSHWEVPTDNRTLGQVCVLTPAPGSRDGHILEHFLQNNMYREQFLTSRRQRCLLQLSRDEKQYFCVFMPKS